MSSFTARRPSTVCPERAPTLKQGMERPSQSGRPPLLLTNLLNDLDTLCTLLAQRVAIGDVLNTYLLAAGMQQDAHDNLNPVPLLINRAASRLLGRLQV